MANTCTITEGIANGEIPATIGSRSIAKNVDERGSLKIRSLIGRYGLADFLEAVFVEMNDIESDSEDYPEVERVKDRLYDIIGWGKLDVVTK
jgi:hypothetical protein